MAAVGLLRRFIWPLHLLAIRIRADIHCADFKLLVPTKRRRRWCAIKQSIHANVHAEGRKFPSSPLEMVGRVTSRDLACGTRLFPARF